MYLCLCCNRSISINWLYKTRYLSIKMFNFFVFFETFEQKYDSCKIFINVMKDKIIYKSSTLVFCFEKISIYLPHLSSINVHDFYGVKQIMMKSV